MTSRDIGTDFVEREALWEQQLSAPCKVLPNSPPLWAGKRAQGGQSRHRGRGEGTCVHDAAHGSFPSISAAVLHRDMRKHLGGQNEYVVIRNEQETSDFIVLLRLPFAGAIRC